jgi:hypothetical protein
MKFTEQKYPILKTIKNGGLETYNMGESDVDPQDLKDSVKDINSIFKQNNIYYLCDSVRKYINNDTFNLGKKMNELLQCDLTDSGVMLYHGGMSIVYDLKSVNGIVTFRAYAMWGENILTSIHQGTLNGLSMNFQEVQCKLHGFVDSPTTKLMGMLMTDIVFKRFAPIETLVINKETNRRGKLNKNRYVNEVKHDVTIIDSNWFTTIIRTKGFGVRGHFAIRACGKGGKDRKIVWIDSYQKNGYIRKAKQLQIN